MSSLHKFSRTGWLLILFFLTFNVVTGYAQSPEIDTLLIEVWPEYDRPEPLIIYRVELDPEVALPVDLTFQLPGYIESMHAVAVENNGSLFSVSEDDVELNRQDDTLLLTFPATTPVVYFEYYDSQMLTKQAQERELAFNFSPLYTINTFIYQVQEPVEAGNFQLDPPASSSFVDDNGLSYRGLTITGMASGDAFESSATYQRSTDVPTVQLTGNVSEHAESGPQQAVNVITESEVSTTPSFNAGYLLIGAGGLLLLGVGVYWWYANRNQTPAKKQRPTPREKAPAAPQTKAADPRSPAQAQAGFCHKCGTSLRTDSNFCHNCGAERRRD